MNEEIVTAIVCERMPIVSYDHVSMCDNSRPYGTRRYQVMTIEFEGKRTIYLMPDDS